MEVFIKENWIQLLLKVLHTDLRFTVGWKQRLEFPVMALNYVVQSSKLI